MSEDRGFATIVVERHGRVAVITLDRPASLNALNSTMMDELAGVATELDRDPGVGAIVLAGKGRAFAAGADIKEMSSYGYADLLVQGAFAGWDRFAAVRTPTVAAVAGYALGGGCELAMMCDLLIASEDARFGQPEIQLATIPGIGGTQRLTRAVGKATAMDMVLTGRMLNATEALQAGLVSRVVPGERLLEESLAVADKIASRSLPAAYLGKAAVASAFESTLADGIRGERAMFYATFALADRAEGMAAFIEKRQPNFTHS